MYYVAMSSRVILETDQRLSESCLWPMQRRFFDQQGVRAFQTATVPHYVTNNPALATAYAEFVLGVLRDHRATPSEEPLHIVELGAGSGRFAFLFLRSLRELLAGAGIPERAVRYVMTDFTPSNLEFWGQHPALRPFCESALLDLALFDAARDGELVLQRSGATLARGGLQLPLVVLANYVLDGLPQDAFSVRDGRLYECLITLTDAPQELSGGHDEAPFAALTSSYQERPAPAAVYPEEAFNRVLADYAAAPGDAALLFPIAGLRCLQRLGALSCAGLVVLCADKGEADPAHARRIGQGGIVTHGSFSLSVDFHAIAAVFRAQGGDALHTSYRQPSLSINVFLCGLPEGRTRETRLAFTRAVDQGRAQDLFVLGQSLSHEALDFAGLVALLRLSRWDPHVLQVCLPYLWARLAQASDAARGELAQAVHRCWDNYYHLGEARDAPFEFGLLLHALDEYEDALRFFQRSRDLYGDDPRTLWNMGVCQCRLGRPEAGAACFTAALVRQPGFVPQGALQYKEPALPPAAPFAPGAAPTAGKGDAV